jgi:hypothetical protein
MKQAILFFLMGSLLLSPKIAFSESSPPPSNPGKTSTPAVPQKTLIGNLKNPDVVEGCGCYFQTPPEEKKKNSKKYIYMSDLEETPAYMNIDGQDVKLKIDGTPPRLPDKVRKGFRYSRKYSAGSIKVQVDFVVTWLCPPKDESCEVTNYDAAISVVKGNQKQVIQTKGGCGC